MDDAKNSTLIAVFTDVLEQLAFMFAEPPENETPHLAAGGIVQATMGFKGPFDGTLDLVVPRAMCEELAANVLGLEPDDEMVTHAPFDALKELLNVTCGNLLTALAGEEPIFDLTIPEVALLGDSAWPALRERPETVYYLVDRYPVLLHLETSA